ncbi:GNAT family N-acetyltransferase [Candidatus Woesearchaeota archaeon]|nr:GNAT family N-acetyltransferase [Candidatus Woesearchaeota archaeon]
MITLRRGTHDDVQHVLALKQSFGETADDDEADFTKYYDWLVDNGLALIAEDSGRLAGFLLAELMPHFEEAELDTVVVLPEYRRSHVGFLFRDELFRVCREHGIKCIYGHVMEDNNAGLEFFKACGAKTAQRMVYVYKML